MIIPAFALALALRQEPSPAIPLAWREGLLCVPVRVGDARTLWFLLDTGSERSYVTKRAMASLQAAGAPVDGDGVLTLDGARLGEFEVGSLHLASEAQGYVDTVDPVADGYLGLDVLGRFQVGIDFREKILRLWPAGVPVKDWFVMPTDEVPTVRIVERPEGRCVPVDLGEVTVPMVLDTGASRTFVHSDVIPYLKRAHKAKVDPKPALFFDGLHSVKAYMVPNVALGPFGLGNRRIEATRLSPATTLGLIGRDFLAPLKLLIDFPGGKMQFVGGEGEPRPSLDGPAVTMTNGLVFRYAAGTTVRVPPRASYTLPPGYREVFRADETVDLVPPKPRAGDAPTTKTGG